MARHGENIRKRKDGRWEGRYLVYSEEKGKKIYRSVYGGTYEVAKEKLTMKKISLTKGKKEHGMAGMETKGGHSRDVSYQESPFVTEMADKWLDEVKCTKKQSTYVKYSMIYRIHLEPLLQGMKIWDVPTAFNWEKISDHLSESMKKSICCVMKQILKFASRQYHMAIPVWDKAVFRKKNKPVEVLTRKEQARLLSVLCQKTDKVKAAVLLCLNTGLRLGELCALKWKDIDFEHEMVSVNQTVQRLYAEGGKTKTVLLETAPKSECSRREIPLSSMISRLFMEIWHEGKYIFGKDKPMEPRTLQNRFKRLVEKAGLKHKNFHILRHPYVKHKTKDFLRIFGLIQCGTLRPHRPLSYCSSIFCSIAAMLKSSSPLFSV